MPLIEPPADVDSTPAATAPAMPGRVPESATPPRRSRHLWIWLVCLASGGAASSYLYFPHHPRLQSAAASSEQVRPIDFSARAEKGKLLLTWNARSEAIKSARRAVLSITDGGREEDVDLSLRVIRAGALVYQPVSSDVTLRLTVSSDGAADAVESVRPDMLAAPPVPPAAVGVNGQAGSAGDAALAPAATRIARLFAPPTPAAPSASVPNVSEPPAIEVSATPGPATIELPARRLTAPPAAPAAPAPAVKRDSAPATATPAAAVVRAPAGPLRVGALTVLRRTAIPYPPYAREAHIGGTVTLDVTIGADGRVRKAVVISGPEALRIAAQEVTGWRFEPPVVGGKPVEAIGRVDVKFTPLMR